MSNHATRIALLLLSLKAVSASAYAGGGGRGSQSHHRWTQAGAFGGARGFQVSVYPEVAIGYPVSQRSALS